MQQAKQFKVPTMVHMIPNIRATVIPSLRLLLGPTHRMANAMIPSYHGVNRQVTVWVRSLPTNHSDETCLLELLEQSCFFSGQNRIGQFGQN